MFQNVSAYINEVSEKYKTGRAGEHAYRPTFEKLIKSLDQKLGVINDPKRTEYGAPDFIFVRGDLIAGYAETKDIDADLDKVEKTEQVKRYLGYSNLILTNYLEFRFFRNGERYGESIIIGKIKDNKIHVQEESVSLLHGAITDFLTAKPEAIKNGVRLARIMGGKARRIRDNVKKFLAMESGNNKELARMYETIKELLVHDLTLESFADMYAQTLVYGLFVARYYDDSPANFTRQEARDLIPASNPFLRHFFDHIAGADFDQRLAYIVNELCEVFQVANVQQLMSQYFQKDLWGKETSEPDPVIHFYEDFLNEYDPVLRKKMGAYYTPLPVVRFIVRAVDHILQKEFKLVDGLAETSKLPNGLHRVQVLDPAVGTGTFISAVIRIIYGRLLKTGQKGRWPTYVHHDLLPRLYGFELMMAPYTIAHLKLSMAFKETGFWKFNRRLGIYLTNSLEQSTPQGTLNLFGFAESLTEESKEASKIKNEKPIMVVIGNPPYSISSSNKGEWILNLIKDYKKNLGERKINLDDDYIKFIRLAEHFIEKNGSGIVAMITNNSFIDGITHRQMRNHLLETFNHVYIFDLHGNSKKKEKTPDGGKDENVFDIQQGVAISIFVRRVGDKKGLSTVHHAELYGKREDKFKALNESNIQTIKWKKLDYSKPYYFFVPKDFGLQDDYDKNFSVTDLFNVYSAGIKTKVDNIAVDFDKKLLGTRIEDIITHKYPLREIIQKFDLNPKTTWEYNNVLKIDYNDHCLTNYDYRPFDQKYIYYDKNFLSRSRSRVMENFFNKDNISIETSRVGDYIFVSKNISDEHFVSDNSFKFPLYLYSEDGSRIPNLKKEIVDEIERIVGKISPEDIFDYIYAVLYSPSYREKYKEFLKIDFPCVSYPKNAKNFKELVTLGAELRSLHLLESPKVKQFITTYPIAGSNVVERPIYKDDKVFINGDQYFGDVPELAWNFYIGGYQPAQKWLKDRKSRTLTNEDIEHYQKIIVVLTETERIMKEIDKIYQEYVI